MRIAFRYMCILIGFSMIFGCEEGVDTTGPEFEAIGPTTETPTTPSTEPPDRPVVNTD